MAHTHLHQDRPMKEMGIAFRMVFALGYAIDFVISLVSSLTGLPWRSWLPGAESCKSLFGGVQAAVYSFMSHTL